MTDAVGRSADSDGEGGGGGGRSSKNSPLLAANDIDTDALTGDRVGVRHRKRRILTVHRRKIEALTLEL